MKYQRPCSVILAVLGICVAISGEALESVGTLPTPALTNVHATASATYDAANKLYTYTYTASNGAGSTGTIDTLNLDVANKYSSGGWYNGNGLPAYPADKLNIPLGGNGGTILTFAQFKKMLEPFLLPPGHFLVPFGIEIPDAWDGALSRDGYASFESRTHASEVHPGHQITGLKLISPGVPVIREMIVVPFWVPVFDGEPDKAEEAKAGRVLQAIRVHLQTLGPAGTGALSWSAFEAEVAQAVKLGWIPDTSLAQTIQDRLNAANAAAVQDHDGTAAKTKLRALLDTLAGASSDQIHTEARDLVRLNAEALIGIIPDTPIPVTPEYSLQPAESAHTVGAPATLIASVVNSSDHDKPLQGYPVRFSIASGPDRYKVEPPPGIRTDANGKATFSYRGHGVGTDEVLLYKPLPSIAAAPQTMASRASATGLPPGAVAEALVHWRNGADLAVPVFIPPVVTTQGGNPIYLTDWTQNLGDRQAGASVTRYYLSQDEPVDPANATVLAERQVPPLAPGEQSRGPSIHTTLPAGLPAGVYHLVACADASQQIMETNEANNCSNSRLQNIISVIVPAKKRSNNPPVCSNAQPDEPLLWPPNHKLYHVTITGVTDPDGDKVTLAVTGIEQDEPVNGQGDGNTAPDVFGVGTAQARVRAERLGGGSGRLYFVRFQATDGKGGSCDGTATVGVPHDRSAKGLPVDTGERYDSTQS